MARAAAALAALVVALAGVTFFALEAGEVIVIHSRGADGELHETRAWIVESEGVVWLEAASPRSVWLHDAAGDPRVTIERGGALRDFVVTPSPGEAARARIRGLLRAKYGWKDVWVGWLFGQPDSVAVRAQPAGGNQSSPSTDASPSQTRTTRESTSAARGVRWSV